MSENISKKNGIGTIFDVKKNEHNDIIRRKINTVIIYIMILSSHLYVIFVYC
jgi:hypothetical protein